MLNSLDIIILIIACEALVELWKKAAPLQPIKNILITITPFLYSKDQQTHLMECPYCFSVWVAIVITLLYFFIDATWIKCIIYILSVHRISNYLHLVFSYIADKQRDVRIARRF